LFLPFYGKNRGKKSTIFAGKTGKNGEKAEKKRGVLHALLHAKGRFDDVAPLFRRMLLKMFFEEGGGSRLAEKSDKIKFNHIFIRSSGLIGWASACRQPAEGRWRTCRIWGG
jgi:hypothetical protein